MRIAIIYATRGGTTRECANLLARELKNDEVTLLEIGKDEISFDGFDRIVIGFSIRMAKALPTARKFLKQNAARLEALDVAYFICCGFTDCFEEYAEKTIPPITVSEITKRRRKRRRLKKRTVPETRNPLTIKKATDSSALGKNRSKNKTSRVASTPPIAAIPESRTSELVILVIFAAKCAASKLTVKFTRKYTST